MAETVLPASLENLKIDWDARSNTDLATDSSNPFSHIGGARKKIKRVASSTANVEKSCPLRIFGVSCSNTNSTFCKCLHYVPTKFEPSSKRLVQVKTNSIFKKNTVLRNSKLNYLKFYSLDDHSCLHSDTISRKLNCQLKCTNVCKTTTDKEGKIGQFGHCVNRLDFQSLVPVTNKESLSSPSTYFDAKSFRKLQLNRVRATKYHPKAPRNTVSSDEDDDCVNDISKKLSVNGINSSSCSQQARLTAHAYCDEHDISIDELASYFENYVHIPKKMSLMAEQMYI